MAAAIVVPFGWLATQYVAFASLFAEITENVPAEIVSLPQGLAAAGLGTVLLWMFAILPGTLPKHADQPDVLPAGLRDAGSEPSAAGPDPGWNRGVHRVAVSLYSGSGHARYERQFRRGEPRECFPAALAWLVATYAYSASLLAAPIFIGYLLYRRGGQLRAGTAIAGMLGGLLGCAGAHIIGTQIRYAIYGIVGSAVCLLVTHAVVRSPRQPVYETASEEVA